MKLVSHKLACITFPTKKAMGVLQQSSRYRGHSAIVRHNTNFATVHTQVTAGGCSVEYMNKLLCQFTSVVEHRMLYTSVLSICMTLLQGHTKSKFVFQFTIVCL